MLKISIFHLLLACAASASEVYLKDVCPNTYCTLKDMEGVNPTMQAPNVKELHLGFCHQLELLSSTPTIRILSLSNCSSDLFEKEDLRLMFNLSKLQLRHSNISELHNDQFSIMYRLQVLELGGNSIGRMANETFRNLTLLENLGLESNSLKSLPVGAFHPLENLRHLDLSDNNISIITGDIFTRNLKLQSLILRGNPLTQLVFATQGPSSFQLLDLSHCRQLKELVLHSSVDTLMLEESGVESLQLAGNKSLLRLQAANSKITHLAWDPISLIELDLRGTELSGGNVSEVLCDMGNLQRLDLSNNSIDTLPLSFNEHSRDVCLLPSLRFLNLSSNRLLNLQIESAVFGPQLAFLDLSYNKLDSILPEALDAAHHLQSLSLAGNDLTTLNYRSIYERHRNLKELALFDNKFSSDFYKEMSDYFRHRDIHFVKKDPTHSGVECQNSDKPKAKHVWSVYDILIVIFILGVLAYARMYLYGRAGGNCCFGCKWGQRTEDTSESRVRFLIRPESET